MLLKGGTVVDPLYNIWENRDILIEGDKIVACEREISGSDFLIVDVCGMHVFPGLIDLHSHLRDPGFPAKETIETGSAAALAGGFTALACMPNTRPVADNRVTIEYIKSKAGNAGNARVYPIGAVSEGQLGERLSSLVEMAREGVCGFSDDGNPVKGSRLMKHAMEYARILDVPVIDHCEDPDFIEGMVHEGSVSVFLGLPGIPDAAETIMVARDIILAEKTGAPLHIAHLSTAAAVELVAQAKERGVPVTAEVTPHHLLLTDEAVANYDPHAKVKPPLRSAEDRKALQQGLRQGIIDAVATDHAPHTPEEKEEGFYAAPFGISGLETAVSLVLSELVAKGIISLARFVEVMATSPARIARLPGGTIIPGSLADITVVDTTARRQIAKEEFYSKGRNTPFDGWEVQGITTMTIVGGLIKMQGGKLCREGDRFI